MFFRRKAPDSGPSGFSYNFTDRVRRVLAQTRQEAVALRHDHIGTEHLLLGLVKEEGGVSAAVLRNLGVTPQQVVERVSELLRPGSEAVEPAKLPYSRSGKEVLELAMAEARELSHSFVGTEHLLLGLLRTRQGIAAEVMNGLGVTLEGARAETLRLLGDTPRPREGFRVRIDDASDLPIYEQIVAQIQEAVATGKLRPGERLAAVRQLADELEIAPGTVARAYAELERRGVVVTEGARGTRVAERPAEKLPEEERPEMLVGLLRPVAVAAFHLGASASELRAALETAMRDIFK